MSNEEFIKNLGFEDFNGAIEHYNGVLENGFSENKDKDFASAWLMTITHLPYFLLVNAISGDNLETVANTLANNIDEDELVKLFELTEQYFRNLKNDTP